MEFLTGTEKRFFEFIASLSDKDKVAILSHNDGDGVLSAVIASKVLGKIDYLEFIDYKVGMMEELAKKLKSAKINKVLIMDFSADSDWEFLQKIEKFAEILIIDHHAYTKDLNSTRTVFLRTKSEFPAAYTCYYLFSKMQAIPEWIGVLGALSDLTYRYTKENAEKIYDDFRFKGEKKNLWEFCIALANALIYFHDKPKEVYDIIMKAKKIEDLRELSVYAKVVEEEFNYYVKDFEKHKEEHKGLFYYYFKPKFNITSMLSTTISLKDKTKTFVFVNQANGTLRVSARNQAGLIDCIKLLQEAVKEIPDSSAGGHVPAAGARVPSKYLPLFKENLLKAYKKIAR
jgi:single-stranded DNA-specific DHH superfamily exonuclease